jgi:hypothetical protein
MDEVGEGGLGFFERHRRHVTKDSPANGTSSTITEMMSGS